MNNGFGMRIKVPMVSYLTMIYLIPNQVDYLLYTVQIHYIMLVTKLVKYRYVERSYQSTVCMFVLQVQTKINNLKV